MNYGIRLVMFCPKRNRLKLFGLPIVPFKKVIDGVFYILRTGCQWKMLSREYGSGSTCHRRFQQWVELDVFKKMRIGLTRHMMAIKESNGPGNP